MAEQSLTKIVIPKEEGKKYIVFAGTDGVWDVTALDKEAIYIDMISKGATAETIVADVKKSWSQEWNYKFQDNPYTKTKIPGYNHDDIGCSIAIIN